MTSDSPFRGRGVRQLPAIATRDNRSIKRLYFALKLPELNFRQIEFEEEGERGTGQISKVPEGLSVSGSYSKIRKCSFDQWIAPVATCQPQLPVWLILCPWVKKAPLRRSSSSARLRSLFSWASSQYDLRILDTNVVTTNADIRKVKNAAIPSGCVTGRLKSRCVR